MLSRQSPKQGWPLINADERRSKTKDLASLYRGSSAFNAVLLAYSFDGVYPLPDGRGSVSTSRLAAELRIRSRGVVRIDCTRSSSFSNSSIRKGFET